MEAKYAELDPQRVEAIAALLPAAPAGFGKPCQDRAAWEDPAVRAKFGNVTPAAEKLLTREFPAWDDEAYLVFSRVGRRHEGEAMLRSRSSWLYPLVIAECLENRGRFVPRLNMVLSEFARQKTWTLPAHDRDLASFHGTRYEVDLGSSAFAHELAEALYLLGDKIDPETRKQVSEAIEIKVFEPVRRTMETGKGNFWLHANHNWNAVCLAGVTGAALAGLPERSERAVFVAAAEHYSRHFVDGFTPDGYCTEGTGYWDYGFGNYLTLREELWQATKGKLDLFADPKIRNMALFGLRIQMNDHLAPPYADCRFGTTPNENLVRYCNAVLGLGLAGYGPPDPQLGSLATACMSIFPNSATTAANASSKAEDPVGLHSYFDNVGVLVSRSAPGSSCRFAASIKAGGNGNHSHNDIGSFVIQLGHEQLVGDPGGPNAYTATTFGPHRFEDKVLNSFGHPVPVVAGKLQRDATKAKPKVLKTSFTNDVDEISIDMVPAYEVPELQSLVRTLKFDRSGAGSITVEDEVAFATPQTFEIALPTHGQWRQANASEIEFTSGREKLVAKIETPDGFDVTSEMVSENILPFARIGLKLKKPVTKAIVRVTFRPAGGK